MSYCIRQSLFAYVIMRSRCSSVHSVDTKKVFYNVRPNEYSHNTFSLTEFSYVEAHNFNIIFLGLKSTSAFRSIDLRKVMKK